MKTYQPKPGEVNQDWFVVDAKGQTLGRLATKIATVLRGKHKPTFSPSVDTGDFVVVINADKVHVTGAKLTDKTYYHHTNHPGGIKDITLEKLLEKKPEEAVKKAVWGMIPKGRLGRVIYSKLKVYGTDTHPHSAQNPKDFPL